jgi:hypothetical protein
MPGLSPALSKRSTPLWATTSSLSSAQSTTTGGPFLFAPLKAIADPEAHAELVKLLDSYLASEDLSPMERAQFKLQREWLVNSTTVPDVEVIYANLPGAVGLPLPDGTMTLWFPVVHSFPLSPISDFDTTFTGSFGV